MFEDLFKLELLLEAKDKASEAIKKVGEEMENVEKHGLSMKAALGGLALGATALTVLGAAAVGLADSFAEAAEAGEQFQAQMSNFVGGMDQARVAMEYTNAEALKLPFSLEQVRQATIKLAESGQNVPQVLPALANIAAAYHTSLTDITDAVNRTIATGSARSLEAYLHMTKGQLAAIGVEWDKHGKIIASSVAPALENLGNNRFGDAAAHQADTLTGSLQILGNTLDLIKETAGEALFAKMQGGLKGVIDWIEKNQDTIKGWASVLGTALGTLGNEAIKLGTLFAQTLGPPLMATINLVVAAWNAAAPAIGTAIGIITSAMSQIGTFLQQKVLPIVYGAIGQMVTWWQQHEKQVEQIWTTITKAIGIFMGSLQQNLADGLNVLRGVWEIGWGYISGVLSAVIDVMTGNWKKLGNDLNNAAVSMAVGILDVFKGLVDKVIQVVEHLKDPINTIEHALYDATKPFADELYGLSVIVEIAFDKMYNKVIDTFKKIQDNNVLKAVVAAVLGPAGLALLGPAASTLKPIALPTSQQIRQGQTDAENTWTLGFRPGVDLTFDKTAAQAQAAFDAKVNALKKQIEQSPNIFTGAPSTYQTLDQSQGTGRSFMDQFKAWLKKNGISFPSFGGDGVSFPSLDGTITPLTTPDKSKTKGAAGPMPPIPSAVHMAGSLDAAYGTVNVSYGGGVARDPSTAMIAHLQEVITHLKAALAKDDALLKSAQGTETNTSASVSLARMLLDHMGRPIVPTPQAHPGARIRSGGGMAIVTRP